MLRDSLYWDIIAMVEVLLALFCFFLMVRMFILFKNKRVSDAKKIGVSFFVLFFILYSASNYEPRFSWEPRVNNISRMLSIVFDIEQYCELNKMEINENNFQNICMKAKIDLTCFLADKYAEKKGVPKESLKYFFEKGWLICPISGSKLLIECPVPPRN